MPLVPVLVQDAFRTVVERVVPVRDFDVVLVFEQFRRKIPHPGVTDDGNDGIEIVLPGNLFGPFEVCAA